MLSYLLLVIFHSFNAVNSHCPLSTIDSAMYVNTVLHAVTRTKKNGLLLWTGSRIHQQYFNRLINHLETRCSATICAKRISILGTLFM